MTDPITPERRAELRASSSRAPYGVWLDIRPEDLLILLDAADERDRLAAELAELRGNLRDDYHTMDELYEYRMLYNALAANAMPDRAVKSWRHSDGEECFGGGWFVVYLHLSTGQVSNHYKAEHWDLFRVPEVELAPEWDGHTPADAADRLRRALDGSDEEQQTDKAHGDAAQPTKPDPLDESNHADRCDRDGGQWVWCDECDGFRSYVHRVHKPSYAWSACGIDKAYGPLTFAPRPAPHAQGEVT